VSPNGRIVVWRNTGNPPPNAFNAGVEYWPGDGAANDYSKYLGFAADVNGDGRIDIVAVNPNGRIVVWRNTGNPPPNAFNAGVEYWPGDGAANNYATYNLPGSYSWPAVAPIQQPVQLPPIVDFPVYPIIPDPDE
jgi:FG-GAP-like repeat